MSTYNLTSTKVIENFSHLVSRMGFDPRPLCEKYQLPEALICDRDALISYPDAAQLLELAAKVCHCADFGLQLADTQPPMNLGVLGLLLKSCQTFGETLETAVRFYHIQSHAVTITLHKNSSHAYMLREDLWLGEVPTFQFCTLTFSHMLKATRFFLGEKWTPAFVTFAYKKPDNFRDYERLFECPVKFDQPESAFGFHIQDLQKTSASYSSELKEYLKNQVEEIEKDFTVSLYQSTEHLIRQLLYNDNCTQDNVAELLNVHPKKLQRELKQAGTTFRKMRAEARLSLAKHFLEDSDLSLTAIAEMLGFSELSALSHAFRDKYQLTPSEWRQQR